MGDTRSTAGSGGEEGPGCDLDLVLGASVSCREGGFGELLDLVLDPAKRCVTHLVVQSDQQHYVGPRLVPLSLARPDDEGGGLLLDCTLRQFGEMSSVREFAPAPLSAPPGEDPSWDVGKVDVLAPMAPSSLDAGSPSYLIDSTVVYDRVPKHEIELGRTSPVHSSDGHHLGHVTAVAVDGRGLLTTLVFEHRHLWTETRIEVPAAAIDQIETDLITLKLTKREARKPSAADS